MVATIKKLHHSAAVSIQMVMSLLVSVFSVAVLEYSKYLNNC